MSSFRLFIVTPELALKALTELKFKVSYANGLLTVERDLTIPQYKAFCKQVIDLTKGEERLFLIKACKSVYNRHLTQLNPGSYQEYLTALYLLAASNKQQI